MEWMALFQRPIIHSQHVSIDSNCLLIVSAVPDLGQDRVFVEPNLSSCNILNYLPQLWELRTDIIKEEESVALSHLCCAAFTFLLFVVTSQHMAQQWHLNRKQTKPQTLRNGRFYKKSDPMLGDSCQCAPGTWTERLKSAPEWNIWAFFYYSVDALSAITLGMWIKPKSH